MTAVGIGGPASATIPTLHVSIVNMAFTPSSITAPLGDYVAWTNHDPFAHTSTSYQGFWGSPHIAPNATFSHRFATAGTFAYHCAIHTYMHGVVRVPMRVTPRTGGGTLVWAVVAGRFDVQVERPGTTTWVTFRSGTAAGSAAYLTSHVGRYLFRARTRIGMTASGWSPAVALYVR